MSCCLFRLLTGALPLRGASLAELTYKIANEAAPDIRNIRKELQAVLSERTAIDLEM